MASLQNIGNGMVFLGNWMLKHFLRTSNNTGILKPSDPFHIHIALLIQRTHTQEEPVKCRGFILFYDVIIVIINFILMSVCICVSVDVMHTCMCVCWPEDNLGCHLHKH